MDRSEAKKKDQPPAFAGGAVAMDQLHGRGPHFPGGLHLRRQAAEGFRGVGPPQLQIQLPHGSVHGSPPISAAK